MAATNVELVVCYDMPTSKTKAGGIYRGNGSPTSALVVPKGSLYIRADATTTTTRMWIATDSVGGWTFLTTNA